jgi:hypothetical protein
MSETPWDRRRRQRDEKVAAMCQTAITEASKPWARRLAGSTDLYRYFNEQGVLLYVGISTHTAERASKHKRISSWWPLWKKCTRTTYPTRVEARQAEKQAIRSEKPLHNVPLAVV